MSLRAWWTLALDVPRRLSRGKVAAILLVFPLLFVALCATVGVEPLESSPRGHGVTVFFGNIIVHSSETLPAASVLLEFLGYLIVNFVGIFYLSTVALVLTSDAVVRAFAPGAAEVTLTKPLGRHEVAIARALGAVGLAAVLHTIVIGGAAGLALARTGLATLHLVLAVPALTLAFAVLHSSATLAGTSLRNPVWGILGGLGALGLSIVVVVAHYLTREYHDVSTGQRVFARLELLTRVMRYALPRPADLFDLAFRCGVGRPLEAGDLLIVANGVAWTMLGYGLVIAMVRARDY